MLQQTDDWFAQRLGKVTASKVKDVMAKGRGGAPSATRQNYMMQLLCERLTGKREEGYTNAAMQRGNDLEPIARAAYEMYEDCEVVEVGLILHPSIDGFGASPDGVILLDNGRRGLEIKCPNTAQHIAVVQSGKHDTQYEWQMLAQMACADLESVDFVSFDDRLPEELQYVCFRYHREEARIREMEAEVMAFLEELAELEHQMRERMRKAA
ncbi:TPA: YqaJ viral recombinase family protein [Pseudomonas aeruginosa]|uniref:lambda exonuclease family protein n=1 Tax=Pseudomonas aeruginosa TaxID=287 RepID=UPI000B49469E|nr:lambda exonuclease family protein [Pseudomonas aeruginosa]MBI7359786.1 YqaJ viral recombinase family protein [Pseudomonas aeruginosa]MCS8361527.1 YqaJ viral recombinase family protein [Pseudomonas aeruginosa]MCS8644873.1 YqaJ viral recombinase family protein [Pseudomonas aeruginosa]MDJ1309752.1 YqaJ viral recombinase family protein [Pseudomonas aeruginosa]MED5065788.1 YqaJ viral recombinase family protein [Pseudomonas aeruginosa]